MHGCIIALMCVCLCVCAYVCVHGCVHVCARCVSEEQGRPGSIYCMNDVRWTSGGRQVDVEHPSSAPMYYNKCKWKVKRGRPGNEATCTCACVSIVYLCTILNR